jgi:hypothetical protein
MSQQARDIYDDEAEFSELLEDARMNAADDWEVNFVADLIKKFEKYGSGMYLSDLQNDRLKRIAAWGEL